MKEERKDIEQHLAALRKSEDDWNTANRWFGFGAIIVGGVLGLGAFISQRNSASASLEQRPENDRIEVIDARTVAINNQTFELASNLALKSAAQARKDAEYANERAGTANKQADEAREATERITRENLILQSQVEQERIERIRLEQKYASRRISQANIQKIADALRAYPNTPVGLMRFNAVPDGLPFEEDLVAALAGGNWTTSRFGQTTGYGELRGLCIIVRKRETAAMAGVLQRALKLGGIDALAFEDPSFTEGRILLFIAPKN